MRNDSFGVRFGVRWPVGSVLSAHSLMTWPQAPPNAVRGNAPVGDLATQIQENVSAAPPTPLPCTRTRGELQKLTGFCRSNGTACFRLRSRSICLWMAVRKLMGDDERRDVISTRSVEDCARAVRVHFGFGWNITMKLPY